MSLPDATMLIRDGAMGVVDSSDNVSAAIGTCSAGPINTPTPCSDPQAVRDTFGEGPLVEYLAHTLSVGGGVIMATRATGSTAGTNSAVVKTGTGTATLALSGAPVDAYNAIVKITRGGATLAAATAAFQVSLDGGQTFLPETAMPVSGIYALGSTGVTLTFTNGAGTAFVVGDAFTFTTTAPAFTVSDVQAAYAALVADPTRWSFVAVIGTPASVAATATLAGALDSLLTGSETAYRFTGALVQCADDTDANIKTGFASFVSARVFVCTGFADITSATSGRVDKRGSIFTVGARLHKAPIHEDLARVKSGALPGVRKLYRDEAITPGLDAARFITLRTHIGRRGFYITNGNTMANVGSDFGLVQFRRVMDAACTVDRDAMLEFLASDFRVNPAGVQAPLVAGGIDERDARVVENEVGRKLRDALIAEGHATAVSIVLNRTDNILSTKKLRSKVRVTPLGYAHTLETEIAFDNPALETVV